MAAFFYRYAGSPDPDEPGLNRVDTTEVTILDGDVVTEAVVDDTGAGVEAVTVPEGVTAPGVGDKVVMDATESVPTGILGQVTAITDGPDGATVAELAPVPIGAVLEEWEVAGTTSLDPTTLPAVVRGGRRAVGSDLDLDCGPASDLTGAIDVDPEVDFDFYASGGPFKDTIIELTATLTLDWQYDATIAVGLQCEAELSFPNPEIPLGAIPLPGPLPPILPDLEFFVGGSVGAATSFTVHLGETTTLTAGVRYVNGATTPVLESDTDQSYGGFDTNPIYGKAELFLGARINLYIAGLAGGYVKVGPSVEGKIQPLIYPWWTIDATLKASFGLGVDLWVAEADIKLFDLTFGNHHLADSGADPWPGPTITTTNLPSGFAGDPYTATIDATGGTPPYTWDVTGLPPGFTWDDNTQTITANNAPPANAQITITISDSNGWRHVVPLQLTIESLINIGGIGEAGVVQHPPGLGPAAFIDVLPSGRLWLQTSDPYNLDDADDWAALAEADGTIVWWSQSILNQSYVGPLEDHAGNLYLFDESNPHGEFTRVTSVSSSGQLRWEQVLAGLSGGDRETDAVKFGRLQAGELSWLARINGDYGPAVVVRLDTDTGAELGRHNGAASVPYLLTDTTTNGYVGSGCDNVFWFDHLGQEIASAETGISCQGWGPWYSESATPAGDLYITPHTYDAEPWVTRFNPDGSEAWTVDLPYEIAWNCPIRTLPNNNVLVGCGNPIRELAHADGSVVRSIDSSGPPGEHLDAAGAFYFAGRAPSLDDPEGPLTDLLVNRLGPTGTGFTDVYRTQILTTDEVEQGYAFSASLREVNDGRIYVWVDRSNGDTQHVEVRVIPLPIAEVPYKTWHWTMTNPFS